jgi:Fe2+ or Zn2+ uptake regulation protein
MTASHLSPALPVSDMDAALAALRSRGLRISAARRLVLESLDGVRAQLRSAFGFEARFEHFPIVGLCPDCRR